MGDRDDPEIQVIWPDEPPREVTGTDLPVSEVRDWPVAPPRRPRPRRSPRVDPAPRPRIGPRQILVASLVLIVVAEAAFLVSRLTL
jgi:hypothetical protein